MSVIINPPADDYKIIVSGFTEGYSISFSGYDCEGSITTQDFHGLIQQYILSYSPEPGSQISVSQIVKIDIKPGSKYQWYIIAGAIAVCILILIIIKVKKEKLNIF